MGVGDGKKLEELIECLECEEHEPEIDLENDVISAHGLFEIGRNLLDFQREYNLDHAEDENGREVHGYTTEWVKVSNDANLEDVYEVTKQGIEDNVVDGHWNRIKEAWKDDRKIFKRMLAGTGIALGGISYLIVAPEISGKEEILLDGEQGIIGGGIVYAYTQWKQLDEKYRPTKGYIPARDDALDNLYIIDTDHRQLSDGEVVRNINHDGIEYVTSRDHPDVRTRREDELEEDCKYVLGVIDPMASKRHLKTVMDGSFIDREFDTYDEVFEEGYAHHPAGCPEALQGLPYRTPLQD